MMRIGLVRGIGLAITVVGLVLSGPARAAGGVVVIGHSNLPGLDAATVERLYKGRVIEINGVAVTPVNFATGSATRTRFLRSYLNEDEDDYTGYWLVRRAVGRGAPPREIANSTAIINYVKSTPGAIAYVDEADVQPGVFVLLK